MDTRAKREQAKKYAASEEGRAKARALGMRRRASQEKTIEKAAAGIVDDDRPFEFPRVRRGRLVFVSTAGERPWQQGPEGGDLFVEQE